LLRLKQETNDLIYEGIATPKAAIFSKRVFRNKRPDLRRDCDAAMRGLTIPSASTRETNDLIYEGIATGIV